jgi:glycosyltransferase involved in cell wall biosynthesis
MVFRYANALAGRGWAVTFVMPPGLREVSWWRGVARYGRYWGWSLTKGYLPRRWMTMDARVRFAWVPDVRPERAPRGDIVIATAVQTAEAVALWPASAGRKFYLVQGYETWDFSPNRVEASWRLPLKKIAVSRWLCDLIAAVGEGAVYAPNGLDHQSWGLDRAVEERRDPTLLWPHHRMPQKGSQNVLAILKGLTSAVPGLRIKAYGTSPAPSVDGVPIEYVRNPSQRRLRELYNEAAVMIAPSHAEGWGLPACEALQCGCGLAASDVGGHREFLRHGHNSLLHAPGDVATLRDNVLRLLMDETLRWRLARQGLADMAVLRFEPAVDRLEQILATGAPA